MAFKNTRTPFSSAFFRDAFFDDDPFSSDLPGFNRAHSARSTRRSPLIDFFGPFQSDFRPTKSTSPLYVRRPTPPLDRRHYWRDDAPNTVYQRPYNRESNKRGNGREGGIVQRTRVPIMSEDDSDDDGRVIAHSVRRSDPVQQQQDNPGLAPPTPQAYSSSSEPRSPLFYTPQEYQSDSDEYFDTEVSEPNRRSPLARAEQIGGHFVEPQRTSATFDDRMEMVKSDETRLKERLKLYGLRVKKEIVGDGNCQFAALADQFFDDTSYHHRVREAIVDWLRNNEEYTLPNGARIGDFVDTEKFADWNAYCDYMNHDGVWGDHFTLLAAAERFSCKIVVISSVVTTPGNDPFTVISAKRPERDRVYYLAHLHELHYTSLEPEDAMQNGNE